MNNDRWIYTLYEYVQIHRNESFGQGGLKIPIASSATGVDEIESKCVFLEGQHCMGTDVQCINCC